MIRRADTKINVAILNERLNNFMDSQEAVHVDIKKEMEGLRTDVAGSLKGFRDKMEEYFKIKLGENGSSREYDLKDILLNHERDIRLAAAKLLLYDRRRMLMDLMEKHPKFSMLVLVTIALGLYYAGSQGIILKIVNIFKPF